MGEDRRKELIRRYHESDRPMGVYRVVNSISGYAVIGSSTDIAARLNRHRAQLELGGHPDRRLQAEWNDGGPGAFVFEVLDTITAKDEPGYDPTEDLAELEALWWERLVSASEEEPET